MNSSTERDFALDVVRQLRDAGFQALWAGGCVRDLLLGNDPQDYDVATSATPQQVREVFGRKRTLTVGMSFGVVIVLAPRHAGGHQIEVATFRTDAGYSDGRHPDHVTFSTPELDAQRRDFTINGMFFEPVQEKVIDYVGGQFDLQRRIIRAIGKAEDRIAEDKLRMLRAVRFAARFGFEIDEETSAAIVRCAAEVGVVSGERIAVEIQKTLATPRAAWAVQTWSSLGLLREILPEIEPGNGANAGIDLNGKLAVEVVATLERASAASWQVKLSLLLVTTLKNEQRRDAIEGIRSRLKLSNTDTEILRFATVQQPLLERADRLPWSEVQPCLVNPAVDVALQVLKARLEDGAKYGSIGWIEQQLAMPAKELNPQPLLGGADLIEMGWKPGPKFKLLIDRARALQLDGKLADKKAAIQWLRTMAEENSQME